MPENFARTFVLVLLVIIFLSKTNQSNIDYLPQIAMIIILSFGFVPAFQGMNAGSTYLKIYRPAVNYYLIKVAKILTEKTKTY